MFGNGDLLLGRGAFDSSNGYSNEANSGPNAQGQSGSSAFDLSDFPSLGGGGSAGDGSGPDGIAAAIRQQQQLMQQQLMQGGGTGTNNKPSQSSGLYRLAMGTSLGATGPNGTNFNVASEDFPALPGAPLGGSSGGTGNSGSGLLGGVESGSSNVSSGISFGGVRNGAFGGSGDLEGLSHQFDSPSLLGGNSTRQESRSSAANGGNVGATTGSSSTGSALSGDYGLLGLLKVIRMTDADRNALALGSDLTSLGLNLNSNDTLYSTFASPWSESPTSREPQYQLPMCYYMQPPALKTGHLKRFDDETLFYIFYALPRDVLQAYSAQELYSREWKYHVELKLWFKRASPADGVSNATGGMQYIYFDINSWERRLFNGSMNQNITSGLLPEDDIRVKFPSS
jgi:CCR4-NOT transcription complex subunit 2